MAVALQDGAFARAGFAASFGALLREHRDAQVVAVDIPIGMLASGSRAADAQARRLLPTRLKSTIFNAPPRVALEAEDYAGACAACEQLLAKRLSRQSYALSAKIREVEPHWRAAPERIFEVHPELSFQQLANRPLCSSKKTWNGHQERASLLVDAGVVVPAELEVAGHAAPDDVLDAAVAAWSAERIARGVNGCVPDPPERDEAGREVAIWY